MSRKYDNDYSVLSMLAALAFYPVETEDPCLKEARYNAKRSLDLYIEPYVKKVLRANLDFIKDRESADPIMKFPVTTMTYLSSNAQTSAFTHGISLNIKPSDSGMEMNSAEELNGLGIPDLALYEFLPTTNALLVTEAIKGRSSYCDITTKEDLAKILGPSTRHFEFHIIVTPEFYNKCTEDTVQRLIALSRGNFGVSKLIVDDSNPCAAYILFRPQFHVYASVTEEGHITCKGSVVDYREYSKALNLTVNIHTSRTMLFYYSNIYTLDLSVLQ